jgi:hypothetical protein
MRGKFLILVLVGIFLINPVFAISDTHVFQGQYYVGTDFQQGTFEFKFDIYTGEVFGDLVYSSTTNLTTGNWGQWRVELEGISAAANNVSKDYFMEITIDDSIQTPRRRLTHFNYLRKDVDEGTTGNLRVEGVMGGDDPMKIEGALSFLNSLGEEEFSYYIAQQTKNYSDVPATFDDSLIIQKSSASNPKDMQVCFWDSENQIMTFCVNEGAPSRATTVRRSLQIVGNVGVKENDENFTLCENTNYIDCSTDVTGADLFVQDDIEAQSIYANENITANDKLIFGLGEFMDNLVDGVIKITGNLLVSGNVEVNGNVTTESLILKNDPINHRIYDNASCTIIKGDTSALYVC